MEREIEFGGTRIRADLQQALSLNSRMSGWRALVFHVGTAILVVLSVVWAVLGQYSFTALGMLMVGFATVFTRGLPWLMAKRSWGPGSPHAEPITGRATESALLVRGETAKSATPWSKFSQYRASQEVVLLYRSGFEFTYLGRQLFRSDSDWGSFRALVGEHVKLGKRGQGEFLNVIWIVLMVGVLAFPLLPLPGSAWSAGPVVPSPIDTSAFDGEYFLDESTSSAFEATDAQVGKESNETQARAREQLRRMMIDQYQILQIENGVLHVGVGIVQEFSLQDGSGDAGQWKGRAIWHEDIGDPGDMTTVTVNLRREENRLEFTFTDEEMPGDTESPLVYYRID